MSTEPKATTTIAEDGVVLSNDASDFVLLSEAVPDAILEIRYYGTYNFVGDRIDGYEEPVALLTKEAAAALKEVMIKHGFKPLVEEWWHFTLENEPFPDTYFTFPVNSDSVSKVA
ncbi:MAG: hypothetical protein K6E72_05085 [Saccharofermentans sp.]|nr:hypothetical protein [Saccharofermentans sp.]